MTDDEGAPRRWWGALFCIFGWSRAHGVALGERHARRGLERPGTVAKPELQIVRWQRPAKEKALGPIAAK